MKLLFLYRKHNGGFSIEGLFSQLATLLRMKPACEVMESHVPAAQPDLGDMTQNLWFAVWQHADIYHITGDVHYLQLALPPDRTVLTIHDCVSLERLQTEGKRIRYYLLWLLYYYLPMRRATYITTVSEKSKRELIQFVGETLGGKIRVIPNHYNPQIKPVARPFNAACTQILHIGTAAHKNLFRLADALRGLSCSLTIVGRLNAADRQYLDQAGISYRQKVNLTNEQMLAEYEACDVVAFVSTYEGFGMPVIEAQAVGRVVITSNIEPMCHIAGQGAHLVDPYDVAAIRAGIKRLISDTSYRETLIEAGTVNARQYTIERVAGQYETLYQEILAHQTHG